MNESKQMYAIAYTVFGADGWVLGSAYAGAASQAEAESKAMQWLCGQYKECAGYLRHRVHVTQITAEDLAQLGYTR